ncbi:GNAT family N-acetyltransferase [Streptococcus henryi]|uniref:GNAT family N-acetyltransferase n=1 Tax=Streptococcus henryi TaxID=439219 RepID=UPI000371AED7|nr:GNAT family N-acetyltransferase [Streptococcus henryi]
MIRIATEQDAQALLDIYSYYVDQTAITFEYEAPSLEEFTDRILKTLAKYPYLVAEEDGKILGYAYAGAFNPRAAYDWAVEVTIYLDKSAQGKGLGKALYTALENALKLQNIINLNACIAYPEVEDQYLSQNSVQYHQHLGYSLVGQFHKCGYKFNTWYDMVWMEKHLSQHLENPQPIRTFPNIRQELGEKYGIK